MKFQASLPWKGRKKVTICRLLQSRLVLKGLSKKQKKWSGYQAFSQFRSQHFQLSIIFSEWRCFLVQPRMATPTDITANERHTPANTRAEDTAPEIYLSNVVINTFLASAEACSPLITVANSLVPDQHRRVLVWIKTLWKGVQWLRGRLLDSRPKGGGFKPHRHHCIVVLEEDTFILA